MSGPAVSGGQKAADLSFPAGLRLPGFCPFSMPSPPLVGGAGYDEGLSALCLTPPVWEPRLGPTESLQPLPAQV